MVTNRATHHVCVCTFSYAKLKCMKEYAKRCITENEPDHMIVVVGTNNSSSELNAERIAKSIIDLAKNSIKEQFTIVPQKDE